ncbi:MAG TPA: RNA polymerase factor sigma-54 [Chitinophagales bacterium]|nr:RNA polymerase factor sigma-54 [Chitinophagales bacterium]
MLNQKLQQKLLQKLSPQQIQLLKLLQLPTIQLEQRIKEELEINPALEEGTEDFETNEQVSEISDQSLETDNTNSEDDIDITEFYNEDDEGVADYKTRDPNEVPDPDDSKKTIPVAAQRSFHQLLEEQLGLLYLDEREKTIALHIIGSLDDDGYLRRDLAAIEDDLAFSQNVICDTDDINKVLLDVQQLEPAGVGARSLQECLLIQLKRKEKPSENTQFALDIVENHFNTFAKRHYEKLEKALNISEEKLKDVLEEITRLNPRPANAIETKDSGGHYILPDFFVHNNDGELSVTLNRQNSPELKINSSFRDMLSEYKNAKNRTKSQQETVQFIKQKIESAKWFIDAIQQRQNTLLATMNAIVHFQYEYFTTGDEAKLKPMILKDIAQTTELDISTISRVTSNKFVQTEFGTFSLKYFFSEALTTDTGDEVSTYEVKKHLKDLIDKESKSTPISDQELTDLLNALGYNIARRTVAKYREALNFPVARLRKEL